MIVTCESCKSRYKLDDAKITGRGAKITCPKCKHVFVVYARPVGDAAAPEVSPPSAQKPPAVAAPAASPSPVVPPPADQEWEDDEPTRIQGDKKGHEVALPPRREPTEERQKGEMAARAAALDFRKVGVTTWKVKVKIGLIYDFSDIKTLRKYIQDGRVTPADVISCDGKTWKPIGEIPDLDVFFAETWDRLAAKRDEEAAAAPRSPSTPPPTEATPSSDPGRAAPPRPAAPEPNSPFRDPFEEMKKSQAAARSGKRPAVTTAATAAEKPASGSKMPMLVAALVIAAVAAGALWWTSQTPPPAPAPASKAGAPPAPGTDADAMRDKINREIEERLARDATTEPAPPPTSASSSASPEMVPVRRDGAPAAAPQQLVPVRPKSAPSGSMGSTQRDQTAADHEAVGDDAASGKDWSTAIAAYQKAAALDPKSARLQEKLGKAQYAAGDAGGAQTTLQNAASLGAREAAKYLGHIAREQGDIPGANTWYQKYLEGNPGDAADVRAIVDQMTKGG